MTGRQGPADDASHVTTDTVSGRYRDRLRADRRTGTPTGHGAGVEAGVPDDTAA
ncbi:hypothetical protein ACFQJ5_09560 [Halomicroarcula sp. GCM10025324]|uniref:hypothetical protein n=1 Tax=Halomicroarcula sp. GCM10025324 TaxID=3252667 RepID=UPI003616F1A1